MHIFRFDRSCEILLCHSSISPETSTYSQSRVMTMHHFLGPKWSTCPKQIFFGKFIKIIVFYLLAPFIAQNFKKILSVDPELGEDVQFLGPKWPICPNENFF